MCSLCRVKAFNQKGCPSCPPENANQLKPSDINVFDSVHTDFDLEYLGFLYTFLEMMQLSGISTSAVFKDVVESNVEILQSQQRVVKSAVYLTWK